MARHGYQPSNQLPSVKATRYVPGDAVVINRPHGHYDGRRGVVRRIEYLPDCADLPIVVDIAPPGWGWPMLIRCAESQLVPASERPLTGIDWQPGQLPPEQW